MMNHQAQRFAMGAIEGIHPVRYRFWYTGHDGTKPLRAGYCTRTDAEQDRAREVRWGCGNVESYTDWSLLPDYLTDLNAVHRVEQNVRQDHNEYLYGQMLDEVVGAKPVKPSSSPVGPYIYDGTKARYATAAQRTEAILRTLGKWRDEVVESQETQKPACPFKVGDRIHELGYATVMMYDGLNKPGICTQAPIPDTSKPDATVIELTARGFRYRYDQPVYIGRAAWNMRVDEGEVFEAGFHQWVPVKS